MCNLENIIIEGRQMFWIGARYLHPNTYAQNGTWIWTDNGHPISAKSAKASCGETEESFEVRI